MTREPRGTALYRVAPYVVVRTPLLPAAARDLARHPERALQDPQVVRALAIGSPTLLERALAADGDAHDRDRVARGLARYLIRMSTRPTPFGAFAAVSLATWAPHTGLRLGAGLRTRTRPDMAWVRGLLAERERRPEVRTGLRWRADPLAVEVGDRIVTPVGGSVRAGEPARVGLAEASSWIAHPELVARIAARTCGRPDQAERLVDQLAAAGLLVGDLVPAVTGPEATSGADATALLRRAAPDRVDELERFAAALRHADRAPVTEAATAFADVTAHAAAVRDGAGGDGGGVRDGGAEGDGGAVPDGGPARDGDAVPDGGAARDGDAGRDGGPVPDGGPARDGGAAPFQTDLARTLAADGLSDAVATECARAVEILLRLSGTAGGSTDLARYTERFAARYGAHREVPLADVVDPVRGLGPMPHTHGSPPVADSARAARRSQLLMTLALDALRESRRTVTLDAATLDALVTWPPDTPAGRALTPANAPDAPLSLDVSAFVLGADPDAVDRGDFTVVIGPNLGASTAGRWLGRFADLVGPDGEACYAWLRGAEQEADTGEVPAEVVYLPPEPRSTNVVLRPTLTTHEIVVSGRGSAAHQVDPGDLLVGHDGTRLYVRSRSLGVLLRPVAHHMLNHHGAPAVVQFLDAVGRAGTIDLASFDWGPAAALPVLPRVQVGRAVLTPARWTLTVPGDDPARALDVGGLQALLDDARRRWGLPDHVYAAMADNRLLLDLSAPDDVAQLRREARSLGGTLRLEEALPDVHDAWLPGPDGGHLAEIVVSLVRRPRPGSAATDDLSREATAAGSAPPVTAAPPVRATDRLRLPGGDWLFAKFYAPYADLTRLLTVDLADLVEMAENSGLARRWFFIRYADPEPHLRVRWQGRPDLLLRHLLPQVGDFAEQLVGDGRLRRLAIDTYEREVERYGGVAGMDACEDLFHADSRAARALLDVDGVDPVGRAVASSVAFLVGLGLDRAARVAQYERQLAGGEDRVTARAAGEEYRVRKAHLRRLAAGDPPSGRLGDALGALTSSLRPAAGRLRELEATGALTGTWPELVPSLLHMHHNRMVGPEGEPAESRLLHLLLRTERGLLLSGDAAAG